MKRRLGEEAFEVDMDKESELEMGKQSGPGEGRQWPAVSCICLD